MSNYDGKISLPEQNVANTNSQHLTEQWKNGTLNYGFYYLQMEDGIIRTDDTVYIVGEKMYRWRYSNICYVQEVLAPVPTYDQFSQLVKKVEELKQQLAEANKILFNVWGCREDREYYDALTESYFEKYGVEK